MNLKKKKELAAKTLKVGKNRIHFSEEGVSEIKEAITKQDIKDLFNEGIITIKPIKGRRKTKRRKTKIGPGKRKKRINKRKEEYVKITKKLRLYLKELKKSKAINRELYIELRKKLRNRYFKSKANLKEYLENPEKIKLDKNKKISKNKTKKK
jgi:large subunit ribosomal protein L19e